MVSGTPSCGPSEIVPMSATGRNRNANWTPSSTMTPGGGDLTGQFGERIEAPLVVQHPEQTDEPARDQDG